MRVRAFMGLGWAPARAGSHEELGRSLSNPSGTVRWATLSRREDAVREARFDLGSLAARTQELTTDADALVREPALALLRAAEQRR